MFGSKNFNLKDWGEFQLNKRHNFKAFIFSDIESMIAYKENQDNVVHV